MNQMTGMTGGSAGSNSSANINMTIPPHYRPYSVALKETPLLVPRLQNTSFPNAPYPLPQHSAFLPPPMCDASSKSAGNASPSPSCTTMPFVPQQPIIPSKNSMHNGNGNNKNGNTTELSMSWDQREIAHLKEVNKDLLERVRQWETWYMMARHELDACSQAHARATHWQAQAEEMQRQKTVLMARVRRWQERWAKVMVVKKKGGKVSVGNKNNANPKNANPEQSATTTATSRDIRTLSRRSASTNNVQMPLLQRGESADSHESNPRPFKKRCFGSSSSTNCEDSSVPSNARAHATKSLIKVPRPILKVRTSASSSSPTTNSRCTTPNDEDSANAAPVTPSPQLPEAKFEA